MASSSNASRRLPPFVGDAACSLGVPVEALDPAMAAFRANGRDTELAGKDVVLETLMLELFVGSLTGEVVLHLERVLMGMILGAKLRDHRLTPERLSEAAVLVNLEPTPKHAVAREFLSHCMIRSRLQLSERLRDGRPFMPYLHRVADRVVLGWHENVDEVGARIAKGCRELVNDPRFRKRHNFEFRSAEDVPFHGDDLDQDKPSLGAIMRGTVGLPGAGASCGQDLLAALGDDFGGLGGEGRMLLLRGPIGAAMVMAAALERALKTNANSRIRLRDLQDLLRAPFGDALAESRESGSRTEPHQGLEFQSKWLVGIATASSVDLRIEAFARLRVRIAEEIPGHTHYQVRRERIAAMVDWFMERWRAGFETSEAHSLLDLCSALARVRPEQREMMAWAKRHDVPGNKSVLAVDRTCILRAIHCVLMGEDSDG